MGIRQLGTSHLSDIERTALEAAARVAANAYNPASGYFVGAAAVGENGSIHSGTFMENASFGMTICAEPAAILAANSAGVSRLRLIAIAGGDQPGAEGSPVTPCGRCRQIILEVAERGRRELHVLCADLGLTNVLHVTSHELLPYPFSGPLEIASSQLELGE